MSNSNAEEKNINSKNIYIYIFDGNEKQKIGRNSRIFNH